MIAQELVIGLKYSSIESLQAKAQSDPMELQNELENLGLNSRKARSVVGTLSGDLSCVIC